MKRLNLHLRGKALALLIPMLVAVALSVTLSGMWLVSGNLDAKLNDELKMQSRVIATLFSDANAHAHVDITAGSVQNIRAESIPDFKNHDLVDRVSTITGGVATIFAWDDGRKDFVRRTTSVKAENGERAVGTALGTTHPAFEAVSAGRMFRGQAELFGCSYFTQYDPVFRDDGSVVGILFVGVEKKYFTETRQSLMNGMAISGAAVSILLSVIGAVAFTYIFRPLGQVNTAVGRLADGQLAVSIPHTDLSDDIGDLARALGVFQQNAIERRRLAEVQAAEEAVRHQRAERVDRLVQEFERVTNGIVGEVSSAATQLQGAAQTMSATAEQTNRQSMAVASASEEASANVQTVAAAAEELAASVSEIGRRVNESAQIAAVAARDADATAEKVARLSQAAQKIGDIVGLISTIAGQTNLLALNATIEAARAGEAGRGFAVVASEVKSLADQTAKATAEISAQIEEIQASTSDSAQAIGQITETIRRMNEIATTIASAVEQQGAATSEIARNVQQASAGTAEVSSNITGVTRAASDSSAASAQVLSSAGNLATQSGVLQEQVQKFLASVRAA